MNAGNEWDTARHVWNTASDEMIRLGSGDLQPVFLEVVRALAATSGRIVTSGCGTSGAAAKKIAHTLSCVERPATFLAPSDAVHGALGSVQPGDVAILFSKGGNTRELLAMIPAIQTKRVTLIGVTENADSALARESDIHVGIRVNREADQFNMLATTSTLTVIAFFDAVAIALIDSTNYTRDQFAVIHPGGAVGDRLLNRKE